jgi:hypothetical protein
MRLLRLTRLLRALIIVLAIAGIGILSAIPATSAAALQQPQPLRAELLQDDDDDDGGSDDDDDGGSGNDDDDDGGSGGSPVAPPDDDDDGGSGYPPPSSPVSPVPLPDDDDDGSDDDDGGSDDDDDDDDRGGRGRGVVAPVGSTIQRTAGSIFIIYELFVRVENGGSRGTFLFIDLDDDLTLAEVTFLENVGYVVRDDDDDDDDDDNGPRRELVIGLGQNNRLAEGESVRLQVRVLYNDDDSETVIASGFRVQVNGRSSEPQRAELPRQTVIDCVDACAAPQPVATP